MEKGITTEEKEGKMSKLHYIFILLCTILFSSCEHKELCYEHPHTALVTIAIDWVDMPAVKPDGMCLFFYPLDNNGNTAPYRFDIGINSNTQIEIQVGRYHLVCYNNDTESVLFRNIPDIFTHEAYTRDGNIFESIYGNTSSYAPKANNAEEERVVISPDMMWGQTIYDIEIKDVSNQIITLSLQELVCTYTYEIRNVTNLKYMTQMCGSLSGMSPSLFLGSAKLADECITLPFESVSDNISTITGCFYTFGHNPENTQPHMLLLYVWLQDGSKYYYTFNVTEHIHNSPDSKHIHIIIDGLSLPEPIKNGSGFQPSVDDWNIIEEDLIL